LATTHSRDASHQAQAGQQQGDGLRLRHWRDASAADLRVPLAAIFRHIAQEDLEDADDLLEEIESLESAKVLEEAVESLVSACLILEDVTRPQAKPMASQKPLAKRGPAPRGRF
jgi:uncharacterized protein